MVLKPVSESTLFYNFYCEENEMHRASILHPSIAVTTEAVLESGISFLPHCLWHPEMGMFPQD